MLRAMWWIWKAMEGRPEGEAFRSASESGAHQRWRSSSASSSAWRTARGMAGTSCFVPRSHGS